MSAIASISLMKESYISQTIVLAFLSLYFMDVQWSLMLLGKLQATFLSSRSLGPYTEIFMAHHYHIHCTVIVKLAPDKS